MTAFRCLGREVERRREALRIVVDGAVELDDHTAQVASGLDVAHQSGLVHRDLKPANVLLAGEGQSEHAYLSDFGSACCSVPTACLGRRPYGVIRAAYKRQVS